MLRKTKLKAIANLLCKQKAEEAFDIAAHEADWSLGSNELSRAVKAATDAWQKRRDWKEAECRWKAMPKKQRDYANNAVSVALRMGEAAAILGGRYSGSTKHEACFGDKPSAVTVTTSGGQYSRRCTYSKTNATHEVSVTVDGIIDLVEASQLAELSSSEEMPLISYCSATGRCVWVQAKGKQIRSQQGWIALDESEGFPVVYHSTKSLQDAIGGAERKAKAAANKAKTRTENARADRRARLVVRICKGVKATVGDAIAAGYCTAGIRAWQDRHGIGDEAPLSELVQTGNPLATKLAFELARKVRRESAVAVQS